MQESDRVPGSSQDERVERVRGKPLADRLNRLFEETGVTLHQVADGIREQGGEPIGVTQLWELRRGVRDNPRMHQLESLAKFFGVPVAYFFDDEVAEKVEADLRWLALQRNQEVQRLAFRASQLSPKALHRFMDLVEYAAELEGHPDPGDGYVPRRRATDRQRGRDE